jgi:hypothetical protein
MNSTPADSSLARIQRGDIGDDRGAHGSPASKAMIVFSLTPTRPASLAHDQPNSWRAALTCSGVIVISRASAASPCAPRGLRRQRKTAI